MVAYVLPTVKFFLLSKEVIPCICLTLHRGRSAVLSDLCAALSVRNLGGSESWSAFWAVPCLSPKTEQHGSCCKGAKRERSHVQDAKDLSMASTHPL